MKCMYCDASSLRKNSSSSRIPGNALISVLQSGKTKQGQPHYNEKRRLGLSSRGWCIVLERRFYKNTEVHS
ncbi:hypothetical protein M0802_012643 [Mischocyttarus mexicanus]|nr:hypothetical protein M0802_012643 [Mischocyttarus mexicanus]